MPVVWLTIDIMSRMQWGAESVREFSSLSFQYNKSEPMNSPITRGAGGACSTDTREEESETKGGLLEAALVLLLRLVYHKPALSAGSGASSKDPRLKPVVEMATNQWEKLLKVPSNHICMIRGLSCTHRHPTQTKIVCFSACVCTYIQSPSPFIV